MSDNSKPLSKLSDRELALRLIATNKDQSLLVKELERRYRETYYRKVLDKGRLF